MSGSTKETEEDLGTAEELLRSDDGASDNDFFRHRIKMSPLRWLRTYLLTIILIPIKFFLLISTVTLVCFIASPGHQNKNKKKYIYFLLLFLHFKKRRGQAVSSVFKLQHKQKSKQRNLVLPIWF